MKNPQTKAIGLTGGIASGKSSVARILTDCGAIVLDSDLIARKVLVPNSIVLDELSDYFGEEILLPDGSLNRPAMLGKLLSRPSDLKIQLSILSGHVLPVIDQEIKEALELHPENLLIVEAPLLFEYGRRDRYSEVILVAVPRCIQVDRLARRAGKSRFWAEKVVSLQWNIEDKIRASDYVIDNSELLDQTRPQVRNIYQLLYEKYFG